MILELFFDNFALLPLAFVLAGLPSTFYLLPTIQNELFSLIVYQCLKIMYQKCVFDTF
ncbi:hypothetical protein DBT_1908 [Dissulfuribacter thermophilus]|uniref:Uncharacterized protein n=1 Tax=Dissulfuribacter thermophilus TaxID=1156395 RepID=A0A1B9F445_9BACT|nr:hypothetical protein DBT_1908 [Dissulfuribacter thermophilus]